ncbi:MAG: alpha-galactosidase, partial [Dysgonamonadaceae bacterium]|nr:alpha-galactosidase [Dysgonamonadaceae bacterium]
MKTFFVLFICSLLSVSPLKASGEQFIRISTNETDLVLQVASNGRLYQTYLGTKLHDDTEFHKLPYALNRVSPGASSQKREVYPCSGTEDYFEPAFAIQHNDGNLTSILEYVSSETKKIDGNVTEFIISMKDNVYPLEVKLHYMTFAKENIIKSWSEISHKEKKPVTISRYASSMLYFESPHYYLTEFSGEWAREVNMTTQELSFGKKVIDTRLGSRAGMFTSPFFEIGLGESPRENSGEVLMGTISWVGNFQFTFEVDNVRNLRVISGINPYASNYELKPGEVFTTPEFIFTFSDNGTGKASRDFHSWARNYQLNDGKGDRMTLLNNWEATYFSFDED